MNELLYLSRADVEKVNYDLKDLIDLMEKAFFEKAHGRTEMPPKPGIHTRPDAFLHAMAAHIPAMNAAGLKWVGGYPENKTKGLPYISSILILNDDDTGFPIAVMDATWITAYRTGAASALSAKYLARPESQTIGLLATGVQARTHLEAMSRLFPLSQVLAYDIDPAAAERFASEMSAKLGLPVQVFSEPREVVANSDIFVTAGPIYKVRRPVIQKDWLKPGVFASAVDYDSMWALDALHSFDKSITDDIPQIQYYQSIGYFDKVHLPEVELGDLVVGRKPGRENDQERTLALNLGLALEDMALARAIYLSAVERGLGVKLPL